MVAGNDAVAVELMVTATLASTDTLPVVRQPEDDGIPATTG
jgi:hypothetical protein